MPEESKEEFIQKHIQNIFFMRALYGHVNAYAGSFANDENALKLENGELVSPLNVKLGVEWQLRSFKFKVIEHLQRVKAPSDLIIELYDWMFKDDV